MFFVSAKIIEYNLKGVKTTQNRPKAWAIVHTFWLQMTQNACFLFQKK
jgi:hypothetical protein